MITMVERVARAIDRAAGLSNLMFIYQHLGFDTAKIARAAIEAMREPTDRMINAAEKACPEGVAEWAMDLAAPKIFGAMIDEALK